MGNNHSSSASSSSLASSSKSRKNKQQQRLGKSASCGSGFTSSATLSSEDEGAKPKEIKDSPPPPPPSSGEDRPSFHYNIHQPKDLLNEKDISTPTNNKGNNTLLVKRHSSAMEFISSKSPLRDYLKEKFSRSQNNASNNGQKDSTGVQQLSPGQVGGQRKSSNVDKFAKLLAQYSVPLLQKQGLISENMIQKHLLPQSPLLSEYLWKYLTAVGGTDITSISEAVLITTAEKIFVLHTDKDQLTFYLKMFSHEKDMVQIESFLDFLISAYQLATVGEPEHSSAFAMKGYNPFEGKEYLEAVVKSCYHIKEEMSICFLVNWLLTNLPRLHHLLHKYMIHQLTTGYTQLATGNATIHTQGGGVTKTSPYPEMKLVSDEEIIISEKVETEEDQLDLVKNGSATKKMDAILLWLLRSSLQPKFLAIFAKKQEQPNKPLSPPHLNTAQFLLQLIHATQNRPSWDILYNSEVDGLSINRFQFHVFNYRGPTLMIISADNGYTFAICADTEWKESCHFWGNEDATLIQLQPEFRIVEKGNKLIYVNFSIRGYPFGLQVGKDPRNVSLDIKPDFSYASFKKMPCRIVNLSVWGCAPKTAQAAQTEYKQWEAKQCENLRKVNINSAEWKDNPDKYLLELAGNYRSYDH